MSIKVELDEIASEMTSRPVSYLITTGDEGPPHLGAAAFRLVDGTLVTGAGRTTRRHVASRSVVSCLWPPAEVGGYSLIIDGDALIAGEGDDASIHITPTWAVLHRPAADPAAADPDADCTQDCRPLPQRS
ncbi:MAG: pyridoxamine 5'-phosphate oxidase family protein [Actinomycetota bacterium]|jgi:hypothetical protein|nr:pyridoxamine 5'-phosphate oxidase family protein [Actinomycetota bacterium]